MRRAACLLLILAAACDKKDDTAPATPPVPSAAASAKMAPGMPAAMPTGGLAPSAVDPSVATWRFAIDPRSVTHIDMPGLKEHIVADTSAAGGTFDLAPHDLAKSRALVRVDVSTLATHTFGNDDDASQTNHARTWLEAVVDGKVDEEQRWAEYAIRSADGLSASDLAAVPAVPSKKPGGEELRTVTATLHGDLRIHGHSLPRDAVVDVTFHYPAGAAADSKPTRLDIKSRQPIHVVLKDYDVHPRDPAGKALAWTTQLVSKVADAADVSVDLGAAPAL
jgi:hypothetical protein